MTLSELKTALEEGGYTCVAWSGGELLTSRERGVKPLLAWIREGQGLRGWAAGERGGGRGGGRLYAEKGVWWGDAGVASEPAADVLRRFGVDAEIGQVVPRIRNRAGTGFCPMETAVQGTDDPAVARAVLEEKVFGTE